MLSTKFVTLLFIKGKGKHLYMMTYQREEVTSAQDGGEWSISCSSHFTTRGRSPVFTRLEVWASWQREDPCQELNPGHPAHVFDCAISTPLFVVVLHITRKTRL
jgi:hypothetical protein